MHIVIQKVLLQSSISNCISYEYGIKNRTRCRKVRKSKSKLDKESFALSFPSSELITNIGTIQPELKASYSGDLEFEKSPSLSNTERTKPEAQQFPVADQPQSMVPVVSIDSLSQPILSLLKQQQPVYPEESTHSGTELDLSSFPFEKISIEDNDLFHSTDTTHQRMTLCNIKF